MKSLLFEVSPLDPVTYAAVPRSWWRRRRSRATCRRAVPRPWIRWTRCGPSSAPSAVQGARAAVKLAKRPMVRSCTTFIRLGIRRESPCYS